MFAFITFVLILVIKVVAYNSFIVNASSVVPAKSVASALATFVTSVPVIFDSFVLFFVEAFEKSNINHPAAVAVVARPILAKKTRASVVIEKLFRHDCVLASSMRLESLVQNYLVGKSLRCALTAETALIASNWRFYFANQKVLRNKASTQFQAVIRGALVRKRLQCQTEVATSIQAAIRSGLVRKLLQRQRETVAKFQAVVRGGQFRKQFKEHNKRARVIQARFRGYLVRRTNNTILKRVHRFFLPLIRSGLKIVMATKWLMFLLQVGTKAFRKNTTTTSTTPTTAQNIMHVFDKDTCSEEDAFQRLTVTAVVEEMYKAWAEKNAVTALRLPRSHPMRGALMTKNSQPKKLPVRRRRERPVRYYIIIGPGKVIRNRKREDVEPETPNKKIRIS